EMPSMDHGSPNNENPVHTENGHYVGKLNFTMTGWWRVHITLKKGDDVICDDKYMDITF
ncbi:MAG: FixH family protein, partial [Bacteroidales bacterium]|nr:FixH family protein [Bacteroidales bacterium]